MRTTAYQAAIRALSTGRWVNPSTRKAIADACMAVADAEHAALTAEVGRLKASLSLMDDEVQVHASGVLAALGAMHRAEDLVAIRDATIERLTYDRNHPYGDGGHRSSSPGW